MTTLDQAVAHPRLKLPPFGAALRERRRAGAHPLCVHLIYGTGWREHHVCAWSYVEPEPHPRIALKPADYWPGAYDFGVGAGLHVCVFDQVGAAGEYESPDLGPARPQYFKFFALLGELAAFAADVEVYSPALHERWSAFELAREQRALTPDRAWPFWWNDSIENSNAQRRQTWLRAALDPGRYDRRQSA